MLKNLNRSLLWLLLICVLALGACGQIRTSYEGIVTDKYSILPAPVFMNVGSTMIPIQGSMEYYIVIEEDNGEVDTLPVYNNIYFKFEKGDRLKLEDDKIYKNNKLIYQ